jgi:hypothetical protein
MKPLITTPTAVRELATGLAPDAISASSTLFWLDGPKFAFLISSDDSETTQRIILWRESYAKERFVPDHLAESRRAVLSRMASFAERARTLPLTLPTGWHQYRHDNLVAFFAIHAGDPHATRWITEVLPGDRSDVIFWQATTSDAKADLAGFARSKPSLPYGLDSEWRDAIAAASEHFLEAKQTSVAQVDIDLPALSPSPESAKSYLEWLEKISQDQRAFIEAPTSKSIRLRGPAGSGKTLTLMLKAVREVLESREADRNARVLIATHSWALATQIQNSIDAMGLGLLDEIEVYPLLFLAQNVWPGYSKESSGLVLIGEDSFSGKQAQLDQIAELLADFIDGDWITYRSKVSEGLRARFDSTSDDDRRALAWDLLIEFGSVIGAAAIFPGAGSNLKYFQLQRAGWMLPLNGRGDQELIFELYVRYMDNLEERSLLTSDQVLSDFLSYLETHAWNRARKNEGYDLVFVDEFHLFNPLERQVLHYMTRDVSAYPSVFMAVDPRQSPSEAFIGIAADETWSSNANTDYGFGLVENFELTTVHRFSPQILELIKHIHHQFPTYDLGANWDIDFSEVESGRADGPLPLALVSASRSAEEIDIYKAVRQLYGNGRLALAVVDTRQWSRFSKLAAEIGRSAKYQVSTVVGRSDVEGLGYRKRGLVVGPAEYLAGLQFETVLVAGIPDMQGSALIANEKTRLLSLLYLAVSRSEREVRLFVNEDDGGVPEVLSRAGENGLLVIEQGSLA